MREEFIYELPSLVEDGLIEEIQIKNPHRQGTIDGYRITDAGRDYLDVIEIMES